MTEEKKRALAGAGVQVEDALQRLMNNEALLERLLQKFAEDGTYPALVRAVEAHDAEQALQAAHTFKGICGNLSMHRLFDLAGRQVLLFRQNNREAAEAVMPEITLAYNAVIAAISFGC